MKALSIRQPWAWLVVNGHKNIENRTWRTNVRGRVLVHAGQAYRSMDHDYYEYYFPEVHKVQIPSYAEIKSLTGGIVGSVDIIDCVRHSASEWKDDDSWGFVLRNPSILPFTPFRGELGFFHCPLFGLEATK